MSGFDERQQKRQAESERDAAETRIQRLGSHIVSGEEVKGDCNMYRHDSLVFAAFRGLDMEGYQEDGLFIFVPSAKQPTAPPDPGFYEFTDYTDLANQ